LGLAALAPPLSRQAVKDSVRRTFQALRIAVNDERSALEALLAALPACLNPGGRAVIVTFHVGEERRVKAAFLAGRQAGVYADVSDGILRPSRPEILANRRSSSARLHWAIKAPSPGRTAG
jgi:16S rRNA (cytosine1402-N4)-methyltransferase